MRTERVILWVSVCMACLCSALAAKTPNIIIIYTDDHGYTDLGVQGVDEQVDTPTLDKLATNGALMTSGYSSAPQCTPSRAGLMSGRIQNEFGLRVNGDGPLPLSETTIAERMKALGYKTGQVGKWHIGDEPDYRPGARGFDEYWYGTINNYLANFDLDGNTISEQTINDTRNRVTVQGEAAETFIDRNHGGPFFLYLALFGPHTPRISTNDDYYLDFPAVDYPNYDDEMDDIRRQGLALVKALDDAVDGVMQKLREYGIEENTLIFFAGDNGAQPKFGGGIGDDTTREKWNGSENIPLRGEKGSLWEGGIKVPMFVYWKDTIPAGQVIDEAVSTLDFTATTLIAGGGTPTSEMDGVNLLPRLTNAASTISRAVPLFWDWGNEIAIRKGDWKLRRDGNGEFLFNLADDPWELTNLKNQEIGKYVELAGELTSWYESLPPEGRSPLLSQGDNLYELGAPNSTAVEPRFAIPYTTPVPAAYPAPIDCPFVDSDGDGMGEYDELIAGRNTNEASDLGFEFSVDGDFEGWDSAIANILNPAVGDGVLFGQTEDFSGRFQNNNFSFDGSQVDNLLVRIKSDASSNLSFRWATATDDTFDTTRKMTGLSYAAGEFDVVVIPLAGHAEWSGQTITRMRINPCSGGGNFEVDCIRASDGDYDNDLIPDTVEAGNGRNPIDPSDGSPIDLQQVTADAVCLTWSNTVGYAYRVATNANLVSGQWETMESGLMGSNGWISCTGSVSAVHNFYRITIE